MPDTQTTIGGGPQTALAYWLKTELFSQFERNRQPLENKWKRNWSDFMCLDSEAFKDGEAEGWRSKAVAPSTKVKVLTAYSIVIDMLLQGGQVPFALKANPDAGLDYDALPAEERSKIDQDIEDAENLIKQQLKDCNADRVYMRSTMAKAIFGESIVCRHVQAVKRKGFRQIAGLDGQNARWEPHQAEKAQPAIRYVPLWNFFRDLEADSPADGCGCFERDWISPYELRKLKGQDFYIPESIERAITQAPPQGGAGTTDDASVGERPPNLQDIPHRRKTIMRLVFWGRVPVRVAEEFERDTFGANAGDKQGPAPSPSLGQEDDGREVDIYAMMAGDEVVRYARNDTGETAPYYRDIWEDCLDSGQATSVCDNNQDMQVVATGLLRAFLDNKKLSANVILALKRQFMPKFDGKIVPGTSIDIAEECDDARKALQQVIIQDVGQTLLDAIGLTERYSDEATQLPKIMQGAVHEKKKPDTLGEINILQQNAGRYLGGVIRNTDEHLTEPMINDFHAYNMMDPENQVGRGDFRAEALGFTSFQDRVVRLQKIMQGLGLCLGSPELAAETKVRDLLREVWKALDVDPDIAMKSKEEKDAEAAELQQAQASQVAMNQQMQAEQMAAAEQIKESDHRRRMELAAVQHGQDLEKKTADIEGQAAIRAMDHAMAPGPVQGQQAAA